MTVRDDADGFELTNEFASVDVSIDRSSNGPRLRIRDLRTGEVNHFDPLELASLVNASHRRDLARFLDPNLLLDQTKGENEDG